MLYETRDEILIRLGENLRAQRLRQNLSQQEVARRSGISLKAVKNLESGAGATVLSLVSACRTLGKLDWIENIAPAIAVSPLEIAKRGSMRVRATGRRKEAAHVQKC